MIYALNSGGDYQAAGPLHLAGDASSWRTPLAKDIKTFKEFQVNCMSAYLQTTVWWHANRLTYIAPSMQNGRDVTHWTLAMDRTYMQQCVAKR